MSGIDDVLQNRLLQGNFRSFSVYKEYSIVNIYLDLLNEVYNSQPSKIFAVSFIFHISYLCYCLLFQWRCRTVKEFQYYMPGVRRYIASLVGILSAIICVKSMTVPNDFCIPAIYLAFTGCMISVMAALLAYGFNGIPNSNVGYLMILFGVMISLPSLNVRLQPDECFVAQTCVGMFHILIGITFLTLNFRRTRNGSVALRKRKRR